DRRSRLSHRPARGVLSETRARCRLASRGADPRRLSRAVGSRHGPSGRGTAHRPGKDHRRDGPVPPRRRAPPADANQRVRVPGPARHDQPGRTGRAPGASMIARRRLLAAGAIVLAMAAVAPAYLKTGFSVGTRVVSIRWNTLPIRYFVTNRDIDGVTAPQLQGVVDRAFATWQRVPGISLSSQFIGFTSSNPVRGDGSTVIGFQARPDLDRVLGATNWVIDSVTGAVLESDIFINSTFAWSTAANGDPSRFDVESVTLHELGHLLGLGHSALGETQLRTPGPGRDVLGKRAVMFPIAYPRGIVLDRTLEADDIVGITDIYATNETARRPGPSARKVPL